MTKQSRPRTNVDIPYGINVDWGVAVVLRKPLAGSDLLCYIGDVAHVDRWGLRITLMDWVMELPVGWDMTFAWDDIDHCVVQTDVSQATGNLVKIQERVNRGLAKDKDTA